MNDFAWIAAAAARVAAAAVAVAEKQAALVELYAPLRDHPVAGPMVAVMMARECAPLLAALTVEAAALRAFERTAREAVKAQGSFKSLVA